ncbi:disulfide oxidoreductase [Paenibacillus ihbetae]|uniref:Disulfide bond formation protein B n=1 Tax=Paenibacillus ihbetae TaxID=1870820 RepID=A0ABX3JXC3_9BACL|nr:disulfide oxidoreductase [Paenibacillus ihbetae]OOC61439.1 disulfide bond formation protein B [Paenibacillus ihbetae]
MNKSGAWLLFAWLVAAVATSGSLFLSEVWHFTPCVLCWYQRIFMYPLVVLLGIAAYRQQTFIVPYILPLIVIGGGISTYHIIIQKLPRSSDAVACGPVSCLNDYLNWFGWLTIPMLALSAFLLIAAALWLARRAQKQEQANEVGAVHA